MVKKLLVFSLLILYSLGTVFCQAEPGNNLGKSLFSLKQDFSDIQYLKTNEYGNVYVSGKASDGVMCIFYLKNNRVVTESVVFAGDGFASALYDKLKEQFSSKHPNVCQYSEHNRAGFLFATFRVYISLGYSDDGEELMTLSYVQGGSDETTCSYFVTNLK